MKTNNEWYQLLPEPYKTQAIENATKVETIDDPSLSLKDAINAFIWKITPKDQGHEYWEKVFNGNYSIYPPEAAWENAPEGTVARYIDENGYVFFHICYPNLAAGWYLDNNVIVATITDMSNIDWKTSLEIKPT